MRKPLPLSVAIITLNEEKNLPRCLESVREMASEIVVVDSGSTDRTAEIARAAGAAFISQPWLGFSGQKNFALERCTQSWVLSLDADEVVSPELAATIRAILEGPASACGFLLNRRTFYLGDWVWHSWYPEWHARLARREKARWCGRALHEKMEVQGTSARLEGDLFHYSYVDFNDHLQRTLKYARASAEELVRSGQVTGRRHLIFSPMLTFLKKIILKQGWRDGWRGWLIAYATAFGVFAKYAFAMEKKAGRKPGGGREG
jgi:glycosyltransferase involved in cell wall biosynthesis